MFSCFCSLICQICEKWCEKKISSLQRKTLSGFHTSAPPPEKLHSELNWLLHCSWEVKIRQTRLVFARSPVIQGSKGQRLYRGWPVIHLASRLCCTILHNDNETFFALLPLQEGDEVSANKDRAFAQTTNKWMPVIIQHPWSQCFEELLLFQGLRTEKASLRPPQWSSPYFYFECDSAALVTCCFLLNKYDIV